jgi:hypothetical protein
MAVIQNIFKNLEYKLNMQDEIKLFRWSQKPIKEKIAQLIDWKEEYSDSHILVKAAEEILKLNYPTEYLKYTAMQKKFKHVYQDYCKERDEIEKHKWLESEKVGKDIGFEKALMDWISYHRSNWRKTKIK